MYAVDLQHKLKTKTKMKQFFLNIYYFFANFFKRLKFKKYEKLLEDAIIDKEANQIILMRQIKKEILKLWPKGRSKYIPLSYPQRMEIKAKIYSQFGKQMQKLHIKINDNLHFV